MGVIDEQYATLLYLKFLQALLVCDDLNEFLKEAEELGIDYKSIPLLEMFREIIGAYTKEHSLPSAIEANAINFVHISRFSSPEEESEEHEKRFQICNEIVTNINKTKGKKEYPFYPALINRLYHGLIFRTWNHFLYARNPEGMQNLLDSYLSLEYYILYSHTELLEDQEFMIFACNFLLNGAYLEALEFLLDDVPELSSDPLFIKRVRKVLTENENLLNEYQGNPVEGSDTSLEDSDEEYVKDKYFWKLHRKVKTRLEKIKKDS